jgi:hypothetical protein
MGKIKAISTSKIKKIIAIRKNRIEKGNREEFIGLNPHSKGDNFSRSIIFFFDKIEDSNITTNAIINNKKQIINKLIIIYIKIFKLYDWKSYILIILYKYL